MIIRPMTECFRFGGFELDVAAYALRRGGERLKLEKIPMEVLILLVRSAGVLVDRTEIQAALWRPDVFVEHDSAINTAVRKIRQVLDDDAQTPRFVETVVGRKLFVAQVECSTPESMAGNHVEAEAPERSAAQHRAFPSYRVTRGQHEFVLSSGDNLLGRDPDANVYIDHPSVSRRHARISIAAGGATLEDLRSRNGTFLDGRKIDRRRELRHGAIIGLGPITLTLVVISGPASTLPMMKDTR